MMSKEPEVERAAHLRLGHYVNSVWICDKRSFTNCSIQLIINRHRHSIARSPSLYFSNNYLKQIIYTHLSKYKLGDCVC